MKTKIKSAARWLWFMGYVGMIVLLGACRPGSNVPVTAMATATQTVVPTSQSVVRLANGAVQVLDENKDWVSVGAETTFDLVGTLQSTNPWKVTGNTFAIRDSTQIAEGLKPSDQVRVRGVILDDATWLANTIEPAGEQARSTITLTGKVTSVDPWSVHRIMLNVTDNTVILGNTTLDMIVRVEILLLEDGTWEVINITPLSDFTEIPGCNMVRATVESANGNEVQFVGWPPLSLGEDIKIEDGAGNAAALKANQSVLVIVCHSQDDQFRITKMIVLGPGAGGALNDGETVLICHKPDNRDGNTLSIAAEAVPAHLAHGDRLGACPRR